MLLVAAALGLLVSRPGASADPAYQLSACSAQEACHSGGGTSTTVGDVPPPHELGRPTCRFRGRSALWRAPSCSLCATPTGTAAPAAVAVGKPARLDRDRRRVRPGRRARAWAARPLGPARVCRARPCRTRWTWSSWRSGSRSPLQLLTGSARRIVCGTLTFGPSATGPAMLARIFASRLARYAAISGGRPTRLQPPPRRVPRFRRGDAIGSRCRDRPAPGPRHDRVLCGQPGQPDHHLRIHQAHPVRCLRRHRDYATLHLVDRIDTPETVAIVRTGLQNPIRARWPATWRGSADNGPSSATTSSSPFVLRSNVARCHGGVASRRRQTGVRGLVFDRRSLTYWSAPKRREWLEVDLRRGGRSPGESPLRLSQATPRRCLRIETSLDGQRWRTWPTTSILAGLRWWKGHPRL
jgi:hypothetical protein